MKMNKKAQEFSVTTLIVIVLAIIVLVVLALGFGTGWGNLWSKITGYFSPVNVDSVKQACSYACTTQASYAYCCQVRDVKFEKSEKATSMTCNNDKRIQATDCEMSCKVLETCDNLVCKDKETVGVIKEADCKTPDTTKKFDNTGKFIETGSVCCKEKNS